MEKLTNKQTTKKPARPESVREHIWFLPTHNPIFKKRKEPFFAPDFYRDFETVPTEKLILTD